MFIPHIASNNVNKDIILEKVSVLIPVYNSEKTIGIVCKRLNETFEDIDFEIVLVNDASRDRSAQVCEELSQEYPETITYVELSRNFGEHNAVMAGLSYVTGNYCIIMDDDLQNPPEEAKKLLAEIIKGYDVVYSQYTKKKDPIFRRIGSKFNDFVANHVINKPSGLYLSSFKCISRFLINEIIKYEGQDPYIDGIILRSTDKVGVVQVVHENRAHGESGYTMKKLISLWASMTLNFSLIPLRIIGVAGFVLTTISFFYSINHLFFDDPIGSLTDHQSIMSVIMILFGLLFTSIALTAEYIGRIYLSINKQPQFIVRRHYLSHNSSTATR